MKILFIGDITGKSGREIVGEELPRLRQEFQPDLVIANADNATHGLGISPKTADELFSLDIDVMTGGNHLFDRKEIIEYLPGQPRLLRCANYPEEVPGEAVFIGKAGNVPYLVTTLVGRVFMSPYESPFKTLDWLLEERGKGIIIRIVDFHAEATSEKLAFARYADGRVSAVIGTHTHVQTADEQILPAGTAFITDVGMTGPHGGIIGMATETVLPRFLTGLPTRFEPAMGMVQLHGLFLEIDDNSGMATTITRIRRDQVESHDKQK